MSISQIVRKIPYCFHLDSLLIFGQHIASETPCPELINVKINSKSKTNKFIKKNFQNRQIDKVGASVAILVDNSTWR